MDFFISISLENTYKNQNVNMLDKKRILVKKVLRNIRSYLPFANKKVHIIFEAEVKFHYFHLEPIVKKIVKDSRYKVTIIKWTEFEDNDRIPGVTYKSFNSFWHDWFNLYDILLTTELERRPAWFVDGIAICMFHGAGAKMAYFKKPELNDYDVIFSVGQMTYDAQIKYVADTVTVEPVGLPVSDELLASEKFPIPKGITLNSSMPTLLYAPSWAYDAKNVSMDDDILNELSKIKNYNIVIRPHPNLLKPSSCSGYDWNIIIDKLKANGIQISYSIDHSVYELLPHVDLLMGDISSVTFEFLIFNRPIILYMKEGVLEAYDAKEFTDPMLSATTRLLNASDLDKTLKNIKNEDEKLIACRTDLLNSMLFNIGSATDSAIKIIEKHAFLIKH